MLDDCKQLTMSDDGGMHRRHDGLSLNISTLNYAKSAGSGRDILSGVIVAVAVSTLIAAGSASRSSAWANVTFSSDQIMTPSSPAPMEQTDVSHAVASVPGTENIYDRSAQLALSTEADWRATQMALVQARQQARVTEPSYMHILDSKSPEMVSYFDVVRNISQLRFMRSSQSQPSVNSSQFDGLN